MSKEIESVTNEELSSETLAEVQGGTVVGGIAGLVGPIVSPPFPIGPAIIEAIRRELERPKGPELKPLDPNPNEARTLTFF